MFGSITRSVRGKLMAAIFVTTFSGLAVAGAALMVYDLRTYQQSRIDDMTTLANVLGAASGPALAFNDARDARDNLALLRVQPSVIAGALYDARGALYAVYSPENIRHIELPEPGTDSHFIKDDRLILSKSILESGRVQCHAG